MINTLDKLIQQYELGQKLDYIFFWGHTPKKSQNIGAFCFSQWYPSPFTVENKTYLVDGAKRSIIS